MGKKNKTKLPEGVDNDFMDVLNEVIKEYDVAFNGLSGGLSADFFYALERNTNKHEKIIHDLVDR